MLEEKPKSERSPGEEPRIAKHLELVRRALGGTHAVLLRAGGSGLGGAPLAPDPVVVLATSFVEGAPVTLGEHLPLTAFIREALQRGSLHYDTTDRWLWAADRALERCVQGLPNAIAIALPDGSPREDCAPEAGRQGSGPFDAPHRTLLILGGPAPLRRRTDTLVRARVDALAEALAGVQHDTAPGPYAAPDGVPAASKDHERERLRSGAAGPDLEARYRRLFDSTTDAIWCVEFDEAPATGTGPLEIAERFLHRARFAEVNAPFAARLGHVLTDGITGARPIDQPGFWLSQDSARLRQLAACDFSARDLVTSEVDAHGRVVRLRSSIFGIWEEGALTGVWALERDVTADIEESQLLRESVDLYGAIIHSALDGICVLDGDLGLLDCNDAFAEIMGTTRELVLARGPVRICPRTAEGPVEFAEIARRGSWRGEAELIRADGRATVIELSCAHNMSRSVAAASGPLDAEHGGAPFGRFYCFVRDLTSRQLAELREREHQDALAQVSRLSTLGEMASGIAHEFNQPLAAIVNYANGCARLLQQRGEGDAMVFRGLAAIGEQGKRASEIIRRLRSFSRRAEQHRDPFNVSELLTDAIELSAQRLLKAGVAIRTEFADVDEEIVADGIQVEQVLMNLLFNALEALRGEPSPRILVRTESVETGRGTGCIETSVLDNGTGVAAEIRPRIFEPFFSGSGQGLGLGLTIAHSIIDVHGGRLWLEDDPERLPPGFTTCFRFTLPRRKDPMPG